MSSARRHERSDTCIPRTIFYRITKQLMNERTSKKMLISSKAAKALQVACEAYVEEIFTAAGHLPRLDKSVTLHKGHMQTAVLLRSATLRAAPIAAA